MPMHWSENQGKTTPERPSVKYTVCFFDRGFLSPLLGLWFRAASTVASREWPFWLYNAKSAMGFESRAPSGAQGGPGKTLR